MLNPIKNSAINSIAENTEKVKSFDTAKREFETAYTSGKDYTTPLYDLAAAVAYSVIAKCIDPQRKTAGERETISSAGYDPTMLALRQGIAADIALLKNTQHAAEHSNYITYNADGEQITKTNKDATNALSKLITETLSDGFDLVQIAAYELLKQAAEHSNGTQWLDRQYNIRRLNRKVYIKKADSIAYKDEQTTPIQEAYRAVRRGIMNSRAVKTDPKNGYTYIEGYTVDEMDRIYIRMSKYADIGGYDCNGNYTANRHDIQTYDSIIERLNLTAKQAKVLQLRQSGYGYKAIATYLGVTASAVKNTVSAIRKKAIEIGFTPDTE